MRAQTISIRESAGKILSCTIFRQGGKKLLSKGHLLKEEDVRLLETEGMEQVWVTQLDEGEVSEDEAVRQVVAEVGCGSLEIRLVTGGRANLMATENCCVLVDDELLKQINCAASVVIATSANFAYARAGERIATIKSTPFAVPQSQLDAVVSILRERGPILQARPIRKPTIGVLYTDAVSGERARALFEPIMTTRLEKAGVSANWILSAVEDENAVARNLEHLFKMNPTAIIAASTTAPAGPDDVIGRALVRTGAQLERFLAPVEPGNLFLLAYRDEIPVLSAPGCYRSAKANVLDVVLPPLLARYRVSGWEVGCLGQGGLLG